MKQELVDLFLSQKVIEHLLCALKNFMQHYFSEGASNSVFNPIIIGDQSGFTLTMFRCSLKYKEHRD